jgi:hypothetical protein
MVDIVHTADYLASTSEITSHGGSGLRFVVDHGALERLGISAGEIEGLADEFAEQYKNYDKLFLDAAA